MPPDAEIEDVPSDEPAPLVLLHNMEFMLSPTGSAMFNDSVEVQVVPNSETVTL